MVLNLVKSIYVFDAKKNSAKFLRSRRKVTSVARNYRKMKFSKINKHFSESAKFVSGRSLKAKNFNLIFNNLLNSDQSFRCF